MAGSCGHTWQPPYDQSRCTHCGHRYIDYIASIKEQCKQLYASLDASKKVGC